MLNSCYNFCEVAYKQLSLTEGVLFNLKDDMKSRLITKKPIDDTPLNFKPMGAKPDIENAADAKKPGDKKEDAADMKKSKKPNKFASKAAQALAGKS